MGRHGATTLQVSSWFSAVLTGVDFSAKSYIPDVWANCTQFPDLNNRKNPHDMLGVEDVGESSDVIKVKDIIIHTNDTDSLGLVSVANSSGTP